MGRGESEIRASALRPDSDHRPSAPGIDRPASGRESFMLRPHPTRFCLGDIRAENPKLLLR